MDIKKFTINDLERFSGIKAHTLRAWEHRYNLLQPGRASNNFRLYTLDELKKVLNISLLKKNGYRISRVALLTALEDKIELLLTDDNKWQKAINDLTINMYHEDPESFEHVLHKLSLTWEIETLIEKILFPFLKVTNLLWIGHKLSEEHIVVTAIRKKLILAIESLNFLGKSDKIVLLFLPDAKQLDLGLLYSNYFLKKRGVHILYLGNDITIQNLETIFHVHPPTYLFTYLPQNHHFPVHELLTCMNENARYVKLVIGNYPLDSAPPVFSDSLIRMSYEQALEFLFTSCS